MTPQRRDMQGLVFLLAFGLCLGLTAPVFAQGPKPGAAVPSERVRSDISTREIEIQSNFTGIEIVIFGAVDNAAPSPDGAPYDVIVVIKGPSQDLVVRRKERVAGIWINGKSETFDNVPGFYAVLSTRPLRAIATEEELAEHRIGFSALDLGPDDNTSVDDDLFRQAMIRLKEEHLLFQDLDNAIGFVGQSLFRGTVDLPVNVPTGLYTTEVYLFRDGQFLSKDESALNVKKVGFERGVYTLAFHHPVVYGLAAVAIALLMGLFAWFLFRKD
ncbi:TIGR02186 family protein [Methyloligella sp. 2.7D]|uniref:TIGR02186 family protein n=1 Tax=unclassified Methyloligella TaxID=2625955 RepID=UPI00157DF2F7|nr:TIGR02186 family protein [Methyloligella sp. GL2]QKP78482.1 TIGR02186 family protein [Methyloligella sp. GL2]